MTDPLYEIDTTDEIFPEILEHTFSTPVLFYCWADSCEPCKTMTPLLSSLAAQFDGQFILAKINQDEQKQVSDQLSIQKLPTIKLVKDGRVIAESTEVLNENDIKSFLDKHLPAPEDERIGQAHKHFEAGEEEEGIALLQQVLSGKPDTITPYLLLAYAQVRASDINAALSTLDTVPENLSQTPEVTSLKGRLIFTSSLIGAPRLDELQQRIVDDANDSEAHYFLASYAVVSNDFEKALDILLTLLTEDPDFRDQAARKTMISIFDILGEDPLTTEYRRKMANLLH